MPQSKSSPTSFMIMSTFSWTELLKASWRPWTDSDSQTISDLLQLYPRKIGYNFPAMSRYISQCFSIVFELFITYTDLSSLGCKHSVPVICAVIRLKTVFSQCL